MIATLTGTVARAGLDSIVVEVGGVGLLVHTTPGTAASMRPGQPATLSTTLVVREDSLTLYGFGSEDERLVFETVQTVSGVGPRLALAVLAVHSPEAVRVALGSGDLAALTKVPGIGKKGAERLVLELRDKIGLARAGEAAATSVPTAAEQEDSRRDQVREALVGLGWSTKQAGDAVASVADSVPAEASVSALLRAALQELGR